MEAPGDPGAGFVCPGTEFLRQATNYEEIGMIGNGAYGTVFKALNLDHGILFAVKKTALPAGDDEQTKWRNELDICEALRHPHIVSYHGHEFSDDC